ncbi:MAG: ATP-binding protein [Lachnospiraceae bacterium]|nr:ATP-binding protein [Lachnospiraceae bacterium]
MVILIAGSSHAGKTVLAKKLVEKYRYSCMSLDHLKMGLIRSGYTDLTPEDDDKMTDLLWPIVKEMIKTAIENDQDMILEGCYFPYDWEDYFESDYKEDIRYICLVMTEDYIENHFENIKKYASVAEDRGDDSGCTKETLLRDNKEALEQCKKHGCDYWLINEEYDVEKWIDSLE